jgi:DNA damage-binding protein 1
MCFALTDGGYHLAVLHQDALRNVQLISRDLEQIKDGWDLSPFPSTIIHPTAISEKIFPSPDDDVPFLVPLHSAGWDEEEGDEGLNFLGGVLVVGGTKIVLYELASEKSRKKQEGKRSRLEKMKASDAKSAKAKQVERDARKRKPTASVDWPWGQVTAWCGVEVDPLRNTRFLFGDVFGNVSLLSADNVKDIGLILVPLGVTSPASTLAYLSNQAVFVGSHLGDSQMITISTFPSDDEQVPPIPVKVKTVDRTALSSLSKRKGKQRASDDMDVDEEADQEAVGGPNGYVITPDGSYIKTVKSFKNIGPIIDAAMVDTDGSGQVRSKVPHKLMHLMSLTATISYVLWRKQHRLLECSSKWKRISGASINTRSSKPHGHLGSQVSFRGPVSSIFIELRLGVLTMLSD